MTVSLSQRLGITLWSSSSTDPLTRQQLADSHTKLDDLTAIDRQGTLADRPAAAAANRGVYYTVTDGANAGVTFRSSGAAWVPLNSTSLVIPHTFQISDEVRLPSGNAFQTLPFYVPAPAPQTARLVGVVYSARAGEGVRFRIRRTPWGGTESELNLGDLVTSNQADGYADADVALGHRDKLRPVVTELNALPLVEAGLTVTLFVRYGR